jgi:hypothetical protein
MATKTVTAKKTAPAKKTLLLKKTPLLKRRLPNLLKHLQSKMQQQI